MHREKRSRTTWAQAKVLAIMSLRREIASWKSLLGHLTILYLYVILIHDVIFLKKVDSNIGIIRQQYI